MGISDTIETTLFQVQRILRIGYCVFPTLFGLFMILWGIFINDWDWILIGVGLAVFLIFGWSMVRAITGNDY